MNGPAQVELARLAADRRPTPVSGSTTAASNPGAGRPNGSAPVLGLVGLVVAHEAHAAGLGHAEHRVAQVRARRPDAVRHDREEVPAPDRGQVASREARVARKMGDGLGEAVHHRRPLALEHVEHAGCVRRVRAHQLGRRRRACRAASRRARRSRRTASWRTAPRRACSGGSGSGCRGAGSARRACGSRPSARRSSPRCARS